MFVPRVRSQVCKFLYLRSKPKWFLSPIAIFSIGDVFNFCSQPSFAHTLSLCHLNECFEETSLKSYLGYQYCFHLEFLQNIFPGQFYRKYFTERISLISIKGSYKCDGEFKKVQKWARKESGKSSMTLHESKIRHI